MQQKGQHAQDAKHRNWLRLSPAQGPAQTPAHKEKLQEGSRDGWESAGPEQWRREREPQLDRGSPAEAAAMTQTASPLRRLSVPASHHHCLQGVSLRLHGHDTRMYPQAPEQGSQHQRPWSLALLLLQLRPPYPPMDLSRR